MATADFTYSWQFTDVNGNSAITDLVLEGESDAGTVAASRTLLNTVGALLAACTNAKITRQSFSVLDMKAQISAGTAPPPASAIYPSVTDGARLQFGSSSGARRALTIPAPLLSDFKTNSNVVNPADTNVSALIAEIVTLGVPPNQTNLYEGGSKVGQSARRRVTHRSL